MFWSEKDVTNSVELSIKGKPSIFSRAPATVEIESKKRSDLLSLRTQ